MKNLYIFFKEFCVILIAKHFHIKTLVFLFENASWSRKIFVTLSRTHLYMRTSISHSIYRHPVKNFLYFPKEKAVQKKYGKHVSRTTFILFIINIRIIIAEAEKKGTPA